MATIVNDRDVLIMATVPRYTAADNRGMFVTPSAAIFSMSADGATASPASFTFQATLLNMRGTVAWSWTDGLAPSVNGNEITLDYAHDAAVSGTITASITVDGEVYTQIATITKVADGEPGQPGARGNVDISVLTAGHVWSDAEAAAGLGAAGYGAPQVRDLVNLYNSDRTFGIQKMFTGQAWIVVDYVYNGNMFVKGSILPESIDTRGLTIRDAAGNIILGSGTGLPTAYAAPGTLNSDLAPAINSAATTANYTSVAGRPQDGNNLILKSTFEDGLPGGWTDSGGGALPVVAVSNQFFSKAVQIASRDNFEYTNLLPVIPGETLYVEAWLDASTTTGSVCLGVRYDRADGSTITWIGPASLGAGNGWTHCSSSTIVPPNAVRAIPWLQIGLTENFGTAHAAALRISRFQSGATAGAPAGTYVGNNLAEDLETLAGATLKAAAAQAAAISAAAAAAQAKADLAQATASAYADGIVTAAEANAIAAAQAKADAAQAAAVAAAAADATAKANVAATTANWANIAGQPNAPASNATVGATIGLNLGGQMTPQNISTYIAAAAIHLGLIDVASIGSLSALTAVIGLLRTATSGARIEISDNLITGYRANNTMSFKISA